MRSVHKSTGTSEGTMPLNHLRYMLNPDMLIQWTRSLARREGTGHTHNSTILCLENPILNEMFADHQKYTNIN